MRESSKRSLNELNHFDCSHKFVSDCIQNVRFFSTKCEILYFVRNVLYMKRPVYELLRYGLYGSSYYEPEPLIKWLENSNAATISLSGC